MSRWRLWWSFLCFLISLLTIFKAPAKPFWYVAIGATEWCYLLVLISWVPLLIPRPLHAGASWLSLAAGLLFITPLLRAWPIARGLPEECLIHFGSVHPREAPGAPARAVPLSVLDLFRGIPSSPVDKDTYIYSHVKNQILSMDIYEMHRHSSQMPCVLIVHGGSWASGDRAELPALNRYLAARGYVVVAVDYRLDSHWHFPAAEEDVFSAIRYLRQHAEELGLNASKIVLLGRSAGGQIALAAAYSGTDPAIRGVIAFYTPNDLAFAYANPSNPLIMDSQKVLENYLGGTPQQLPDRYRAASPLNEVGPNTPPTLLIHGARDELVLVVHSDRLSKRLAAANRPYLYLRLPWATHGCDANFQGPSGQLSTYAIERFLASVTRQSISILFIGLKLGPIKTIGLSGRIF